MSGPPVFEETGHAASGKVNRKKNSHLRRVRPDYPELALFQSGRRSDGALVRREPGAPLVTEKEWKRLKLAAQQRAERKQRRKGLS